MRTYIIHCAGSCGEVMGLMEVSDTYPYPGDDAVGALCEHCAKDLLNRQALKINKEIKRMARNINPSTLNLIKSFEGLSLKPYLCPAQVPTIGYGTTVYPSGVKVSVHDANITEAEAEKFLLQDVKKFCEAVERLVKVELNDNQFGALVSFTYNVGEGALEKSTLLRKLNSPNYDGAAEEFLKWDHASGKVLPGLTKRRQAERALFLHPVQS